MNTPVETRREMRALVLAQTWPVGDSGTGIALRSALLEYAKAFDGVSYVCVSPQSSSEVALDAVPGVTYHHVPIRRGPKAIRFVRSLTGARPAVTMQFCSAGTVSSLSRVLSEVMADGDWVAIVEDLPLCVHISTIKEAASSAPIAIRSHNVLGEVFEKFKSVGSVFHRAAWHLENFRIRRFERKSLESADLLWAISSRDSLEYANRYEVDPPPVVGVSIDAARYSDVARTDENAVVTVGLADLRKTPGIVEFVRNVWPRIMHAIRGTRLLIAGRNTEQFSDMEAGVEGLGYVNDDRDVLGRGNVFINTQQIGSGVKLKSLVAMAAGLTLVSTSKGIEGIDATPGRHFVVSDELSEWADLIVDLLEHPDKALRIGNAARQFVLENYSQSALSRDMEPILSELRRLGERHSVASGAY